MLIGTFSKIMINWLHRNGGLQKQLAGLNGEKAYIRITMKVFKEIKTAVESRNINRKIARDERGTWISWSEHRYCGWNVTRPLQYNVSFKQCIHDASRRVQTNETQFRSVAEHASGFIRASAVTWRRKYRQQFAFLLNLYKESKLIGKRVKLQ